MDDAFIGGVALARFPASNRACCPEKTPAHCPTVRADLRQDGGLVRAVWTLHVVHTELGTFAERIVTKDGSSGSPRGGLSMGVLTGSPSPAICPVAWLSPGFEAVAIYIARVH